MKDIKRKSVFIALLLFVFTLLLPIKSNAAYYQDFIKHPNSTIYDETNNGAHLKGPQFDGAYTYVRLVQEGGTYKSIQENAELTWRTLAGTWVTTKWNTNADYMTTTAGAIMRVKNVGMLNGEPLVFAIKYVDPSGSMRVSEKVNGLNPYIGSAVYESNLQFWVEDMQGNVIDDPNVVFLYSLDTNYTNSAVKKSYLDFVNNGTQHYIVAPSNTKNFELDMDNDVKRPHLTSIAATAYNEFRPYTYGTNQVNGPTNMTQRADNAYRFDAEIFLSNKNTLGIKFPYQAPFIYPTINKDTSYDKFSADLKVSQELFLQTYLVQYADPLTIDVKEATGKTGYIDFDKIDLNAIEVKSRKNPSLKNIGTPSIVGSGANKALRMTISRAKQEELGNDGIVITGDLPINFDKPGLFDAYEYIDGEAYVTIPQVTAFNNEARLGTEDNPGPLKETTADLKVRVPGPEGDPVAGISVIEDTNSDTLHPEDLVENLRSVVPGDLVTVEGIREKNKLLKPGQTGYDSVTVVIKSTETGLTTDIKVPILVISKNLDILEPIKIIADEITETNGAVFNYDPTFEMNIRKPGGSQWTTMNSLKIYLTYSDQFLKVTKPTDFSVYADNTLLNPLSDYTIINTGKPNEFCINFTNQIINNRLTGKKLSIKQNSKIITDQKDILTSSIYKKVSDEQFKFTYPITAYYQFSDDALPAIITQTPKSMKNKVFNYEPVIDAQDKEPGKTIEPTNNIGQAEDYVKINNIPDFKFDNKFNVTFVNPQPDFSTAGEKKFKVLVTSDAFGYNDEIEIVRNVIEPKVKMSVKQVYETKNSQAIYNDLDNKSTVPNNITQDVRIGDPLSPIIDALIKDDVLMKLNYDWYDTITKSDYKILVDGTVVNTTVVPNKPFELIFEYNGLMSLDVSDLDYKTIETTGENHKVHTLPQNIVGKNKDVEVINTTLNTDWYLKVSVPKGIKHVATDKAYLGGLEYKETAASTPIEISDSATMFAEQTISNSKLKTIVPMNIDLYQNIGNDTGNYKGELHWVLENTP